MRITLSAPWIQSLGSPRRKRERMQGSFIWRTSAATKGGLDSENTIILPKSTITIHETSQVDVDSERTAALADDECEEEDNDEDCILSSCLANVGEQDSKRIFSARTVHFSPTAQLHVYAEVDSHALAVDQFWYLPEEIHEFKTSFKLSRDQICSCCDGVTDEHNSSSMGEEQTSSSSSSSEFIQAIVQYYDECCVLDDKQEQQETKTSDDNERKDDAEQGDDTTSFSSHLLQHDRWPSLQSQLQLCSPQNVGVETGVIRTKRRYDGQKRLLRQYGIVCPRTKSHDRKKRTRRPHPACHQAGGGSPEDDDDNSTTRIQRLDAEEIALRCQSISLASRRFAHAVAVGVYYSNSPAES